MSQLAKDVGALLRRDGFVIRMITRTKGDTATRLQLGTSSVTVFDIGRVTTQGPDAARLSLVLELRDGRVYAAPPKERGPGSRRFVAMLDAAIKGGVAKGFVKTIRGRVPKPLVEAVGKKRKRKKHSRSGGRRTDALDHRIPGSFEMGKRR